MLPIFPIPPHSLKFAMETFIRIGRWGTCIECPRSDSTYPEFCINTSRYDHLLTADNLAEQITHWSKNVCRT